MRCVQFFRRQGDDHLSGAALEGFSVENIGQIELAIAFFGPPFADGQQLREAAIGGPVLRKHQQAGGILKIQPAAHHQAQPCLLGSHMGTNHAGQAVAVGDGDRRMTERGGLQYKLARVRCAPEERVIGGNLEFRVLDHANHAKKPCRYQAGGRSGR